MSSAFPACLNSYLSLFLDLTTYSWKFSSFSWKSARIFWQMDVRGFKAHESVSTTSPSFKICYTEWFVGYCCLYWHSLLCVRHLFARDFLTKWSTAAFTSRCLPFFGPMKLALGSCHTRRYGSTGIPSTNVCFTYRKFTSCSPIPVLWWVSQGNTKHFKNIFRKWLINVSHFMAEIIPAMQSVATHFTHWVIPALTFLSHKGMCTKVTVRETKEMSFSEMQVINPETKPEIYKNLPISKG
jgi:hypothetical protein